MRRRKTAFVAMSGGVDSSVAALLLARQGYDVTGVFMRCWGGGSSLSGFGASCAERDAEDARRVANRLGIPFYVWDFEDEYKALVVEYMVDGYRRGLTPNPDVMCNREIKFGLFLEKAFSAGADYVATGHYVKRVARSADRSSAADYALHAARDGAKDQSYFLWTLTQEKLARCLFPIGDCLKPEVRRIAAEAGLPTADKKDSQGICFLGKVTLSEFLKQYIPEERGAVLTASGEKIGEHSGACFYTVGQRHIGMASRKPTGPRRGDFEPLYVAGKDVKSNTLVVAEGSDHPALYRKEVRLTGVHFINPIDVRLTDGGAPVLARVRYRQPLAKAKLETRNEKSGVRARLVFEEPQKFVAPGQSAVFYVKNGDHSASSGLRMLGGGVIAR